MSFSSIWRRAEWKKRGGAALVAAGVMAATIGGSAANGAATPDRPLKGHCDTSYEILSFDGTNLRVVHHGTCTMTLIGRGPLFKDELVNITVEPATVSGGIAIFTAANGDELHATETALIEPPDAETGAFTFTGGWVFSSGTGRFANAVGSVTWSNGVGNAAELTTSRDFSGTLAYNANGSNSAFRFRTVPRH